MAFANETRPTVGAIRWDAWYGDSGPVKEVEHSLGQKKFHFRLPFFARVLGDDQVSINGDSPEIMDREIAFAAGAGLNYWAFVDYGDEGNLTIARRLYQASPNKRGLHFCFVEDGGRLAASGSNAWPRLIKCFKDPDYQKVLDGRPLLFVFGTPKKMGKPQFQQLSAVANLAGLKQPYLVLMGWNPQENLKTLQALGFDAWSAYAAGGKYSGVMLPYPQLTDWERKHYWETCQRLHIPMVTPVTTGWDTRPRIERPVSWMPNIVAEPDMTPPAQQKSLNDNVTATQELLSQHIRDAIAWTQANRDINSANAIILYAWNENDEGGWLIPTLNSDGSTNVSRIKALQESLSAFPPASHK